MGYLKDLGESVVAGICPDTGYPLDEYGRLLNSLDPRDGCPVKDWDKQGTELYNFTSPYGHLHFAHGSGDDFHCFDYEVIDAGPRGSFIILESAINSETGCFIMGGTYKVLPCNSQAEKEYALAFAQGIVDLAVEWCHDNGIKVTKRGWNQDAQHFVRCVAMALFSYEFKDFNKGGDLFSDRQMRFGGKKIDALVSRLMCKNGIFGDVLEASR